MKRSFSLRPLGLLACILVVQSIQANDWPQWRGPDRNGISHETGLLKEWPKDGPKLVWAAADIGSGYATPSIVGKRIYVLGNNGLENEFVQALSVEDGKRIWMTPLGKVGNPKQQPNFPAARSTPTVEGDVLFALGSDGDLACLEIASGKVKWQKSLRADFGGKPGEWAYSESPLVDGDKLVCTPGGADATIIALNKKTGEVIWKCAVPGGDEAAYASVVATQGGGVSQYVQLLKGGLVGVDARTGKFLWRYAKAVSRYGANIPTPLASDGFIFTASAGTGAGLVKLKAKDSSVEAEQVYFDLKLPTTIGGTIKLGKNLFGTTGQGMVCLDFATGQVKWEDKALQGPAAMCYAGDRLYLHGENGEVALVEPSEKAYVEKGRFTPADQPQRAGPMEKPWAYPVVANGHLYIRDHGKLWCYDVKAR